MAFVQVQGWGASKWKVHTDTDDFPSAFRLRGWGGGAQWRMHCDDTPAPVRGSGDGQYKLRCEAQV